MFVFQMIAETGAIFGLIFAKIFALFSVTSQTYNRYENILRLQYSKHRNFPSR